jgi:hypothetical protein
MQLNNPPVNQSPAHVWFLKNLPEIRSRARACLVGLRADDREEAMAEVTAAVFKATVHASARGTLDRVTPYCAVVFAVCQYRQGRRMAGYTSTDVLSDAARVLQRVQVTSLESPVVTPRRSRFVECADTLAETLADRRMDGDPSEQARLNIDYPAIFAAEKVSRRARQLFRLLSEVRGWGCANRMAEILKVSPGRVSQLKKQLADALATHGYAPC